MKKEDDWVVARFTGHKFFSNDTDSTISTYDFEKELDKRVEQFLKAVPSYMLYDEAFREFKKFLNKT